MNDPVNHHPLRCRCGAIEGRVRLPAAAVRAVCYCKDCQAYARFLGHPGEVLDDAGGTDVVAIAPSQVDFVRGIESLACVSLTPKGLLRWYAGCCSTPIGNTPRNPKVHYLGLVHNCLSSAQRPIERTFGPARMRVNTASATRGSVKPTPVATAAGMVKLMPSLLLARMSGRWRDNPFFGAADGRPIRAPRVLTAAELAAVKPAA